MAETEGILQTPNIGLYKPDYENIADIQVLNENFDKLDTTIKQAGDDLTAHNIDTEAHEKRFNQYLPLTGGTMKGDIVFPQGKDIYNSADNGMTVSSNPANAEKSSKLVLSPKSTGGAFSIHCGDGTNEGILTAYPTGELYWNGSDIKNPIKNASISGKVITLTFADGTTKTLTTQDTAPFTARATAIGGASTTKPAVIVKTYRSGNTWYRKYSDGWIEQGGITENISANSYTVTFPTAFTSTNYYANFIMHGYAKDDSYGHMVTKKTTTSLTWNDWLMNDVPVAWYACGV